jgi:hypothetical protein
MKALLIGNRGVITLELLIAFGIGAIAFSAIFGLAFSVHDSIFIEEMKSGAKETIEARISSFLYSSSSSFVLSPETQDGAYVIKEKIIPVNPCISAFKQEVSWKSGLISRSFENHALKALLEEQELYQEPCISSLLDLEKWISPETETSELDINLDSTARVTDIDVVNSFLYVSYQSHVATDPDFSVASLDPDSGSGEIISETDFNFIINSLDVAGDYAYLAVAATSSQFVVLNLENKKNKNSPEIVAQVSLPEIDPIGSYPSAFSVFYYNNFVFVGTKETAGPEFHVFDVSDPTNPIHKGSIELTHNINAISAQGNYAFLATSADTGELIVIDFSNPSNLVVAAFVNLGLALLADKDATAIYTTKDQAFVGRKRGIGSNHELYVFSILDPSNPELITSKKLPINNSNAFVSDIFVGSELATVAVAGDGGALFMISLEDLQEIDPDLEIIYEDAGSEQVALDYIFNGFITASSDLEITKYYEEF